MAQSIPALSFAPLYVARDLGYFEQQGVKLEFTELQSGATAIQAIVGGSVDVVDSASTEVAAAAAQGLPVIAVQGTVNMTLEVCASKKLIDSKGVTTSSPLQQRMAVFKGTTIAITGPGAVSDNAMRWLLQKYGGLDPNRDANLVSVGGASAMSGALQQDRVQGFLLSPPNCELAAKDGSAVVLVKPSEIPEFTNYVHEVLYTTKDWANKNKDLLTKTATALSMGNNYMLQYPNESIALLQKTFNQVDPQIVADSLKTIVLPQVPKDGKMTEAMWKDTNTVLFESGLVKQPIDTKEGGIWTNEYIGNPRVP
jgi:NitT/TauT family transport system substrate-binding protein